MIKSKHKDIQMKKLLLTTFAVLSLATAAFAEDLSFGAYGEYALEAESLSLGVSAAYTVNATTLAVEVNTIKYSGLNLDLDTVDLSLTQSLSENANLYGVVTLDSDLEYDETVIGLAVTF
jgi:opacity protein-like surface antigen